MKSQGAAIMLRYIIRISIFLFNIFWVMTEPAFSGTIKEQNHSSVTSTVSSIVPSHPRIWIKGNWDWDKDSVGTFAWRIMHGSPMESNNPANDQAKYEYAGLAEAADYMYNSGSDVTYNLRPMWPIIIAKALQLNWNFPRTLPSISIPYNPQHNADEYFSDAKAKLLWLISQATKYEMPDYVVMRGSVAYDWLVNEKYSTGKPVLSDIEKTKIQQGLITHADYLRSKANGLGKLFEAADISNYTYVMVGLALYEPTRLDDPSYATINNSAKIYLDDFDIYWMGKIIPALNAQGGDGGWHGGLGVMTAEDFNPYYTKKEVLPWHVSRVLFAHYTATGQKIENSLFNTGFMKYGVVFQNYMIRPNGQYYDIGPIVDSRYIWIGPLRMYSRQRFSSGLEQQKFGELGDWIRRNKAPTSYVDAGSYDLFDQLLFEDKWVQPRSPEQIGFPKTLHFQKLGWVFMRTGFTNANDLAALFICQRYHWSYLDLYAQNSFTLERKSNLVRGYDNTVKIDDQGQRTISEGAFPSVAQGVQAYSPGSVFDVGPGITKFESTNNYDYVMGDATNAYDRNKMQKYTRQLVFLKPDKFIIFDRVISKDAGAKKSWIVKPGAAPKLQGQGLTLIENGAGALWIKRLLPQAVTETVNADRIEIVPTNQVQEHFFLHVMQTAESGQTKDAPNVKADEAQSFSSGNWIGVTIGADSVQFDVNGGVKIFLNSIPTVIKTGRSGSVPLLFNLSQNSPNPFSSITEISYEVNAETEVEMVIFTLMGQRVVTLVSGRQTPGQKAVRWDGKDENRNDMPTGLYLCRLVIGEKSDLKKILLVR